MRTTDFDSIAIVLLSPTRAAALRQRGAKPLEDRLQHVLSVAALDQAHMERQARPFGELSQEPGNEIGPEAADTHVREIDVGDEQRPSRGLESDLGKRLVGRDGGRAVPARYLGM